MKKRNLVCLLSIISLAGMQGQEKRYQLDSVVVSAPKKSASQVQLAKNAQSSAVLSLYDWQRGNGLSLEQTLGTLNGVQVENRTHFGGQRVVVRGYGNDQKFNNWGVKFYLNGSPITSADGVTILEDMDFSLLTQTDVIKGPAGTLYGSGVGGVLRFRISPEKQQGTSLNQKTLAGSFGTWGSSTTLNATGENYSILLNYNHLESDGYRPRGNTNKNNYTFVGDFSLNPKQKISVYASHHNSYQGVDGQISFEDYYAGRDPGNGAYARRQAHNHFIGSRMIISHQAEISPHISASTSAFYYALDTERVAAGAFEASEQPSYGFRTEWSGRSRWGQNFRTFTQVGAEYTLSRPLVSNWRFNGNLAKPAMQMKDISKASYFKYHNYSALFFASNRLEYSPLEMSLITGLSANASGYQRKDLLFFPGLLTANKKDASLTKDLPVVVSPHIALQKTWAGQIFNLSYSEGYNAPTAATAYIKATGKTNDDLKTERARMWDFSAQGNFARWDYELSLFTMRVKDKLSNLSATDAHGTQYSYWANTGKQRNQGLELSLGYDYSGQDAFLSRVRPYVRFSLYDFQYQDFTVGGKNYKGNKVVGTPTHKYSVGLDFETRIGLYMRNTFNYMSDVYTDFANEVKVKGFGLYHAKIGYKYQYKNWLADVFVLGNNLTSQIHYTYLFVGNAVGDNDPDNGYPAGTITDINPAPSKAYFTAGLNLTYRF